MRGERARLFFEIFHEMAWRFGICMCLLLGLPFALIGASHGGAVGVARGILLGVALGLAAGVFYGTCMAAVLGSMQLLMAGDPKVCHQRTLVIHASSKDARTFCVEALKILRSLRKVSVTDDGSGGSRIEASIGVNWRTLGDIVTCDISPAGPSRQVVLLRSRPEEAATLADYGKNRANVERVASRLREMGAQEEGAA